MSSGEICCQFAGKISRGLSFQWSLTCRVYQSLYIYLDPPLGIKFQVCERSFLVGFLGAHISHPTEGFRYIHHQLSKGNPFFGGDIFPYHPCMVYEPLKNNHFM